MNTTYSEYIANLVNNNPFGSVLAYTRIVCRNTGIPEEVSEAYSKANMVKYDTTTIQGKVEYLIAEGEDPAYARSLAQDWEDDETSGWCD